MRTPVLDVFYVFDRWTLVLDSSKQRNFPNIGEVTNALSSEGLVIGKVKIVAALPTSKENLHNLSIEKVDDFDIRDARFLEF